LAKNSKMPYEEMQPFLDGVNNAAKAMSRFTSCPTEATEQEQLFTWARWASGKYPELELMYHIPNGGGRSKAEAGRFKAMGVKAGVPDIFLPCARGGYNGMYIGLKRVRGGRVEPAQREWLKLLAEQGYYCVVCRGMEQASREIVRYLEGEIVWRKD